ncbi:MAG: PIN domain-containing protein [Roseburia sp.]|nr:PIN domain-containing protein [Roseburia sp.]
MKNMRLMVDTNIFLDVLYAYMQRAADFEDCLLATCAKSNQCDAIVTRNKKDFISFGVTLLTPLELLELFRE